MVSSVSCGILISGLQKRNILFLVFFRNLLRHVGIENFETNSSNVGQPIRSPDRRLHLDVISINMLSNILGHSTKNRLFLRGYADFREHQTCKTFPSFVDKIKTHTSIRGHVSTRFRYKFPVIFVGCKNNPKHVLFIC